MLIPYATKHSLDISIFNNLKSSIIRNAGAKFFL